MYFVLLCYLAFNCLQSFHLQIRCLSNDAEEKAAAEAAEDHKRGRSKPNIFLKIIDKSIPADIIYEDDKVLKTLH